jgi:hypothetical protein
VKERERESEREKSREIEKEREREEIRSGACRKESEYNNSDKTALEACHEK